MSKNNTSRRSFLQQGVALSGGSWLRFSAPGVAALAQAACSAKEESRAFSNLSAAEAIEFEAIAARILPTTATPGAREAGVIWFFDQTFGTINADKSQIAREGLAEFQAAIKSGSLFSELDDAAQDEHLATQDQSPFFNMIRFMTLCGFFGMSKYGGNKGNTGWQVLEVDPDQHVFESPFGYYDAEYMKENPGA